MRRRLPAVIVAPLQRTKHRRLLGLYNGDHCTIVIDPRQSQLEFLATAVHELMHHVQPNLTERQVRRIEGVVAPILWALGYRRRKR